MLDTVGKPEMSEPEANKNADKVKKRRGRNRILTREQILETTKELLREPDVEFSMRELGQRLGVPHRTIYNYFESRDLLLKTLFMQLLQDIPRLSSDSPLPIREQLRNEMFGWRDFVVQYRELMDSLSSIRRQGGDKDGDKGNDKGGMELSQLGPSVQVLADRGIGPLRAMFIYSSLLNWVMSTARLMTDAGNWSKNYHAVLRQHEISAEFPALHAAVHDERFPASGEEYFAMNLEILLDGLLGDVQ